jgi:hypothetical protein
VDDLATDLLGDRPAVGPPGELCVLRLNG